MRLTLLSLLLATATLHAQPYNWQWSTAAPGSAVLRGTATDADGNTYMAGDLVYEQTFAPLPTIFTGVVISDGFVVKYDPGGDALWVVLFAGSGVDACRSVSLDASGGVYVTGSFASPLLTIGTAQFTLSGDQEPSRRNSPAMVTCFGPRTFPMVRQGSKKAVPSRRTDRGRAT